MLCTCEEKEYYFFLLGWYGEIRRDRRWFEKMCMVCCVDASALLYNSFFFSSSYIFVVTLFKYRKGRKLERNR